MTRISATLPTSSELEAVLVAKENPEEITKKLAGLRSILNYRLIPNPVKLIRDTYFDNADRSLGKRNVNLRTREINGDLLISVKSGARMTLRGIKRRETELPWSNSNLARAAKALNLQPLPGTPTTQSSELEPREALAGMGLMVVQDRRTRREARDITSELDPTGLVLAELALDRVTYQFGDQAVSIFEVEVEAKTKSSSIIKDVTEDLLSTYKPMLQRWAHGKFVTGKAIEKLLKDGTLKDMLSETLLNPAGFDRLDHLIRSGQI